MRQRRWMTAALCVVLLVAAGCSDDDGNDAATTDTTAADTTDTTAGDTTDTAPGDASTTSAPDDLAEAAEIDLTAAEFSYDSGGVTEVPAGRVVVNLSNSGELEHQATIVRFKDGKSFADLAAMGEDIAQLDDIVDTFGGPNGAEPGASVVTTVELEPGSYTFMCFIPDQADAQPHVAKGQLLPFEVTESEAPSPGLPEVPEEETVLLDDFEFEIPEGFTGAGSVAIENVGDQMHELAAYKVADGATADDVIGILTGEVVPEGPPPLAGATGIGAMNAGQTNVLEADLTPGEWVFICFLPEADTGAPHFTEGMVRAVTIE